MTFRRVRGTALAESDLIDIWLYIAVENPAAADQLLDRIERRKQVPATHPFSGVAREDLGNGLREAVIGNHLVFYRVEVGGVEIVRVLHGKRNLSEEELGE